MVNSRQKGKRIERFFLDTYLKELWPDAKTNRADQAADGGVDIVGVPFDCEIKGGKAYKSKMIQKIIEQINAEGSDNRIKIAFIKPDREDEYVLIPKNTIKAIMSTIWMITKLSTE